MADCDGRLGIADTTIGGLIALKNAGEERLLDAAVSGTIPLYVVMDIAKANSPEMQRELLKAYETKQLNGVKVRTIKRLMEQREFIGKEREANPHARKTCASAESLINAYRRESQKQKLLIKKARLCEAKLTFTVTAFKKLLADDNFITLLRAEPLAQMPTYLHERVAGSQEEAA